MARCILCFLFGWEGVNMLQNVFITWDLKPNSAINVFCFDHIMNYICRRHDDVWSHYHYISHYITLAVIIRYIHQPYHDLTKYNVMGWMDDSHPLYPVEIGPPIPEIRQFQTLALKLKDKGHEWPRGDVIHPAQYLINSLPFVSHQSDKNHWVLLYGEFDLEKSKVQVNGEGKGQGHIVHPIWNRFTSFRFTSIVPTIPEIWPIECLILKKHIRNFNTISLKNYDQNFPKI